MNLFAFVVECFINLRVGFSFAVALKGGLSFFSACPFVRCLNMEGNAVKMVVRI